MHVSYFGTAAVGVAVAALVFTNRVVSRRSKVNRSSQGAKQPDSKRRVNAMEQVKNWFKARNKRGKFIRLRDAWRYSKGLYHFHQRQRFLNFLTGRAGMLLGIWKPISVPAWLSQRRHHVYVERSTNARRVKKLARGDNLYSCDLIRELENPNALATYKRVLMDVKQDPWLGHHCVRACEIRGDGGYTSEYIEGVNLAQLRHDLFAPARLPAEVRDRLLQAIAGLLQDLKGYCRQHGHLIGDWSLHNLIFSTESQTIVNVDAEGFFTYSAGTGEASLQFVETNLSNLAKLITLIDSPSIAHAKIVDVFRVMDQVRRSDEQYSGVGFVAGYHSLKLNGHEFRGQRECTDRLLRVPFDFHDKVVLDLGCNVGGMLHPISNHIRIGYGFDSNTDCINTASLIRNLNRSFNLEFFTFDLDRGDLSLLKCFLLEEKVDICFLLSMCRWLDRWTTVVRYACSLSEAMLFESNGDVKEQGDQLAVLRDLYKNVALLSETSDDDFSLGNRKLYLCTQRYSDSLQAVI